MHTNYGLMSMEIRQYRGETKWIESGGGGGISTDICIHIDIEPHRTTESKLDAGYKGHIASVVHNKY